MQQKLLNEGFVFWTFLEDITGFCLGAGVLFARKAAHRLWADFTVLQKGLARL